MKQAIKPVENLNEITKNIQDTVTKCIKSGDDESLIALRSCICNLVSKIDLEKINREDELDSLERDKLSELFEDYKELTTGHSIDIDINLVCKTNIFWNTKSPTWEDLQNDDIKIDHSFREVFEEITGNPEVVDVIKQIKTDIKEFKRKVKRLSKELGLSEESLWEYIHANIYKPKLKLV